MPDCTGGDHDDLYTGGYGAMERHLANSLTILREGNTDTLDYLRALDDIAEWHNIRTETVIRYVT